jgi:Short repeat of unknown function (DUF308)
MLSGAVRSCVPDIAREKALTGWLSALYVGGNANRPLERGSAENGGSVNRAFVAPMLLFGLGTFLLARHHAGGPGPPLRWLSPHRRDPGCPVGADETARRGAPLGGLPAGLASLAAGVVTFLWPGGTALALLYVVAVWAIVRGVFEIIAAFHRRRELSNEWLLALNGVLTALLGVVLIIAPGAGGSRGAMVEWLRGARGRHPDDRARLPAQGHEGHCRSLWQVAA